MNITITKSGNAMLVNCEYIKGYTFKMVAPRGKSACMTGVAAGTRENCAYFDDTTCLSPFDRVS